MFNLTYGTRFFTVIHLAAVAHRSAPGGNMEMHEICTIWHTMDKNGI